MTEKDYKIVPYDDFEKVVDPPKYGYGIRHVQSLIFSACLTICFIARGHLGVTIVAMTMKTESNITMTEIKLNNTVNHISYLYNETEKFVKELRNMSEFNTANIDEINRPDQSTIYKTYNWSKSTQEKILGSFFLGYCIMMLPIGLVCQKWGGKLPIQIAMATNAILSVLTPWVVSWGDWKALCSVRILQGMTQAGLFPGVHTLLANWLPESERGSLTSYVYTGCAIGTMLSFQFSGILAYSRFGWPSIFWMVGFICFIGFILLTFFGTATAKIHKSISIEEKAYIEGGGGKAVVTKPNTPWRLILTSPPAWATFLAHSGSGITYIFFYMQVPTYMHAILKFDIMNSGLLSSLPYIAMIVSSLAFGYLTDIFTKMNMMSLKTIRQLWNTIASIIPAVCVMLVSYTSDTSLAVFYFIASLAGNAIMQAGWMVNYMDLSPNYSGAIMAFGNTITNGLVLLVPLLMSNIVLDVTNLKQWRTIMFVMGGITLVTNLIFITFMSTDIQPFDDFKGTKNKTEAEEIALECEQKNTEN